VNSVGQGIALDVRTGSDLGECKIQAAASVTNSEVHCGDLVELWDVSDRVNVSTKDSNVIDDAISVRLAGVSAGSPGGTITSQDGTINLWLPFGQLFSVQAQSAADGLVNVNGTPAECSVAEAAATSKTLSCGTGGPNYVVTAGTDTLGDGDVNLHFE